LTEKASFELEPELVSMATLMVSQVSRDFAIGRAFPPPHDSIHQTPPKGAIGSFPCPSKERRRRKRLQCHDDLPQQASWIESASF